MNNQLFWLLAFLLLLLLLIIISELLHRRFKLPPEQSRKFLHVSGGMMCLFFPSLFSSHWWVLALATVAFIILLITYKRKMLPSVHLTKRYSIGSVLFPIPVYLCFLCAQLKGNDLFFYLPVSLLAIADTAAEAGGNKWGHLTRSFFNGQKTLAGSLSFLILAIIICAILFGPVFHLPLQDALLVGSLIVLLSTIAELVTLHGWDNLSIPIVTMAILLLLI
jgi:phytol kinase